MVLFPSKILALSCAKFPMPFPIIINFFLKEFQAN